MTRREPCTIQIGISRYENTGKIATNYRALLRKISCKDRASYSDTGWRRLIGCLIFVGENTDMKIHTIQIGLSRYENMKVRYE